MATLTRRGFIKQSSLGAAALGALVAAPGLDISSAGTAGAEVAATGLPAAEVTGPLVAHVRDIASGEISVLVDTREFIVRDPALVARLVRAIH